MRKIAVAAALATHPTRSPPHFLRQHHGHVQQHQDKVLVPWPARGTLSSQQGGCPITPSNHSTQPPHHTHQTPRRCGPSSCCSSSWGPAAPPLGRFAPPCRRASGRGPCGGALFCQAAKAAAAATSWEEEAWGEDHPCRPQP